MALPERERWARLSPLLDELLECDPAARQHRLAQLQGSDPALAAELQALLAASGAAAEAGFLARTLHTEAAAAPTLVGKAVGAYVIDAPLGQGGMGSVWLAHRADGQFEGRVAVKLLHLSLVGRAGAQRFRREAAILARLTHPHIAHLLDAGVTDEGQPYLVLQLVEGQRIDAWCDARRLGVAERLALFGQVLAAVAHAHSHLVIHRDIKPDNILVADDGSVKLLDFGVARLLQDDDAAGAELTVESQRAFTPLYAAPEQVGGGPVTTATDVYALGVVLYGLLVGRHPTAADTSSPAEVLRATLDTEPTPLGRALAAAAAVEQLAADRDATPAQLRRQLDADLDNILAKALRKDPAERYATVDALADDLRRRREHEPVGAGPPTLAYRGRKLVRRHRGALTAAALVLFSLAAGLVGTLRQAHRAETERDHALRQLSYAEASNEFISNLLEAGGDKPFTTHELLARGELVLNQQFSTEPAQRAHLELMLGTLYALSNQTEDSIRLTSRAQQSAARGQDPVLGASIDCELAARQHLQGNGELARPLFEAAIARLRAQPEHAGVALADCLYQRGVALRQQGDPQAAIADQQAAQAALGEPRPENRTLAILIRAGLADAQADVGQSAAAAGEYRRAIAELTALGRGQTQSSSVLHNNLGRVLASAGQLQQAAPVLGTAIALAQAVGGAGDDATQQGNQARMLIEFGRYEQAKAVAEAALAKVDTPGRPPTLAASVIALQVAPAWCATGDAARCGQLLALAQTGLVAGLPPGHTRLGALAMVQAQRATLQGDLPQARSDLVRACAIFDAAKDRNRLGIRALSQLARTELRLGDVDAAQRHATQAVDQARAALGGFEHSEWLGSALVAQGLVLKARGQDEQARAAWRAAQVELQDTVDETTPSLVEARGLLARAAPGERAPG